MPLITLCQLRYYMLYRRNSQELKSNLRKNLISTMNTVTSQTSQKRIYAFYITALKIGANAWNMTVNSVTKINDRCNT